MPDSEFGFGSGLDKTQVKKIDLCRKRCSVEILTNIDTHAFDGASIIWKGSSTPSRRDNIDVDM